MDTQLKFNYEKETGVPFSDSLTGLFTHGFYQTALDWECKRFARQGKSFTIGLVDIDNFAIYNRINGHDKGDQAIMDIALIIRQCIRESDVACRYAGDVFALLLLDSDAVTATKPYERIRQAVMEKYRGQLTISAGLASFPRDASSKVTLIDKVMEALSKAKKTGKNTVHVFDNKTRSLDANRSTILVVDDEPRNLKLLEAILTPLKYNVVKACNGEEALSIVHKMTVDLVLSDIMMPVMDGYEVCKYLKQNENTRLIPLIMVTALNDMESRIKGIETGADDFLSKPINKIEIQARTKALISTKKLNDKLTSIENMIVLLANAVEAKDKCTEGHVQRVSEMAVLLGKKLSLASHEITALRYGGILHDIGKIGVSDTILNKLGPLSGEERQMINQHPLVGYKICLPLKKTLGIAIDMILHHHEKLDGSGYPEGLKGDDISVAARIMAIADIYDALISDRPYKKGMSHQQAMSILSREADAGQLDKTIIDLI